MGKISSKNKTIFVLVVVIAALFSFGVLKEVKRQQNTPSVELVTEQLPINKGIGGDFYLSSVSSNEQHEVAAFSQYYQGKITLLNFGFTSCPDICPTVLNKMAQVLKQVDQQDPRLSSILLPAFVTFDPKRDTQARLKEFLSYFDERFVGFTGSEASIAAVAKNYGVFYQQMDADKPDAPINYSHSAFMYLMDDKGQVRALYNEEEDIDVIVKDVLLLSKGIEISDNDKKEQAEQSNLAKQITVKDAFIRMTPAVSANTAAYFKIQNDSDQDIVLTEVKASFVKQAHMHSTIKQDGKMHMQALENLVIKSGDALLFEPGAKHLMLIGLAEPLVESQEYQIDLVFETFKVSQAFKVKRF